MINTWRPTASTSKDKTDKETLQKEVSQLKSEMGDIKALLLTLVKSEKLIMTVEKVSQEELHAQFKTRLRV